MNKSESITELAKALTKAQAEMKGAVKDSSNPFFKSTYADLASVWDAVRGPFTKQGLSFVQAVNFDPAYPDHVFVETTMLHLSGEFVSGVIGMKPVKSDPQSVGSCITYCRRYGLQALSGVAPEDDDGNAASGTSNAQKPSKPATPAPTIPEPPKVDPGPLQTANKVSEAQLKRLFTLANKSDKTKQDIIGWLSERGMNSSKELNTEQYDELCLWIQAPKERSVDFISCPDGQERPVAYCKEGCPNETCEKGIAK
jgi:hypothetical protein